MSAFCKNCKFFKKMRGYPFGDCSNDDVFQYAETKEDLKDLGENVLVIMGEGIPVVGVTYVCSHYVSRKASHDKVLSATGDFSDLGGGFRPDAQKKREGVHFRRR